MNEQICETITCLVDKYIWGFGCFGVLILVTIVIVAVVVGETIIKKK